MPINCIRALLECAVESHPEKTALVDDGTRLSYTETLTRANQIAQYLQELDLPKGARVGIYAKKSASQVLAILAVLSTEYVLVPLTRLLKPEQVQYIIDDCDIQCIVTDRLKLSSIEEIQFGGHVISIETTHQDIPSFEEIFKYYKKPFSCVINGHDNAAITYSFGLTGTPKGIVLSHRNLMDSADVVTHYLELNEHDVISGLLIFNLDYGLNQIFCSLMSKATLALHRFILPEDFFNHIVNDEVTVLPLMPVNISQMFDEDLYSVPAVELFDKVRTITSSGGNVTRKMIADCEKTFRNASFYSMHGLTEAFRSTYLAPEQIKIRPDSIGKAIPGVELHVLDEQGQPCAPRTVGELIHRGGYIYRGFWNAPQETEERFKSVQILKQAVELEGQLADEIVVASGDYVYQDEEGYFYFAYRRDDMIKTSGFRVSPYEVESVVEKCFPSIRQCAVFGISNPQIEEEIVMVYSAPGELSDKEITFELKKHLATYMLPHRIVYRRSLPLVQSDQNQINKEQLKSEISQ